MATFRAAWRSKKSGEIVTVTVTSGERTGLKVDGIGADAHYLARFFALAPFPKPRRRRPSKSKHQAA
jgi:hypothetical protein